MAIRTLVYVGLLYQHLIRENRLAQNGQLPPVFPLVLYNGDARWNAVQDVKDLIALPANTPLWSYQPVLRYYLVDESRYPEGKAGSLVGVLFQIENCKNLEELRPIVQHLTEHWQKQIPASLRRAFISWIRRVVAPSKGVELEPQDIEDFAEVQIMLATRIKQWEQEIRKQEFEKGILSGEAKLLHRQLQLRFGALPTWAEEKLAHATRAELDLWGAKILSAVTLDEVFLSMTLGG